MIRYYYQSHFKDDETESQRNPGIFSPQVVGTEAEIQAQLSISRAHTQVLHPLGCTEPQEHLSCGHKWYSTGYENSLASGLQFLPWIKLLHNKEEITSFPALSPYLTESAE